MRQEQGHWRGYGEACWPDRTWKSGDAGHHRRNLTILAAGGGCGVIWQGHRLVYKKDETPLGNLRLSMLKHSGCPTQSFADSNDVLDEIFI